VNETVSEHSEMEVLVNPNSADDSVVDEASDDETNQNIRPQKIFKKSSNKASKTGQVSLKLNRNTAETEMNNNSKFLGRMRKGEY